MKLVFILTLAFLIFIYSIMRAFSAIVGAGGNLPKIISQAQKMIGKPEQNINQDEEDNDMQNKPASQLYRAIAGIVFSIVFLYPVVFLGDKPAIEISSESRIFLFIFLLILEIALFLVIQKKDRDYQKKITDAHIDDKKTPMA